jgi:hypothetical protein
MEDAGYNAEGDLEDHWFRITSGSNDDAIRRCDSYAASVATLASGANLASGSSVTFEVYTRDPQELINYLNAARTAAFPDLHREVFDRDISAATGQTRFARPTGIRRVNRLYEESRLASAHADSIISSLDSDFEGDLTDFTQTNATLVAEDETATPDNKMVWAGNQSGKITVAAGATGYVYLSVPSPTNYVGQELNHSLWLHALTVASVTVKAAARTDAGSWSVGDSHGGDAWERLSVALSDMSISSSIHVGVEIVNGSADDYVVYTDEWLSTAGRTENPYPSGDPILVWYEEGDTIVIPNGVQQNKQLLVRGIGTVSAVAAGSDEMEVDEENYEVLWQSAIAAMTEADFQDLDQSELNAVQRLNTHARNRREDSAMVLPSTRKTIV